MIEVIKKITSKLKETSYSIFSDESTTYEEAREYAEETISDAIRSFTNYACCVAHMQRMIQVWIMTSHYEGQEFRDKVEDLDHKRRIAHDAAISNLSMLNRICNMLDVKGFEVNLNDRYAVGNWIGMFCSKLYDNGIENITDNNYLEKISKLFSKANEQNGYNAAEKASDAVEKIDKIYLNKCLGNVGLETW